MKITINKSIEINASKEKVWETLINDKTYRIWSAAFHEGSYYEGDWTEGSTIKFKDPDGNGIISKVLIHKPAEMISVEHIGVLNKNQPLTDDDDMNSWIGFHETYKVSENNGVTTFLLEQDTTQEYIGMFNEMWDNALKKLKELCEK